MKKSLKYLYFVLCMMLMFTIPVSAYIDPSVMTYGISVIAGAAVVVGTVVGVLWRKAKKKVQHKNALQATENEKERAVLDAKSEFQKRLEEYTAKYEQKLEELEKRNKELLVLTERNSKLKKELSKLKKKDIIYDIDETSDDDVWEV